MGERTKYFPREGLPFWDRLRCFSGMWEQVETGKYLPIVISEDGENLGVEGDPEEVERAKRDSRAYMVSGRPPAAYIGCREYENSTYLYWKGSEGAYYSDIVGVMEMERIAREAHKRNLDKGRKKKGWCR